MKRKLISKKLVEPFLLYDISVENDNCFELENGIIAHNSLYPKTIVGGGTGSYYGSDNIFIIGRQQDKDGSELAGYNFVLNVEKSRYVREKSKFIVNVKFEGGIDKWSGLLDIALESGHVIKPSNGWYQKVDMSTGEILDGKCREKETHTKAFWEPILADPKFGEFIKTKFQLSSSSLVTEDDVEDVYSDLDDEA